MAFLLGAVGAQKAISLQVYCVLLLLRTQQTQHRVRTKGRKLRGSGEKKAIVLQFYRVLCFRRRSRRKTNSVPEAKTHYTTAVKWHYSPPTPVA